MEITPPNLIVDRMKDSLSIILPVQDCQSSIERQMTELLEFLCELTNDVQVIAVDDHSLDATPEVLEELRRRFPQLEIFRTQRRIGAASASESMLDRAVGEFIFLNQSFEMVDYEEILQLWKLRKDDQLVVARASTRVRPIDQQLLQRLQEWGKRLDVPWPAHRANASGLQMMRRDGIRELSNVKDTYDTLEVTHKSHRRISAPKFLQSPSRATPTPTNAK